MGCGKTLICLTVILATRGHFPRIPVQYQEAIYPVRRTTGSLLEMAAAAANRHLLPWKTYFDQLRGMLRTRIGDHTSLHRSFLSARTGTEKWNG
jgi:hypothetical protein